MAWWLDGTWLLSRWEIINIARRTGCVNGGGGGGGGDEGEGWVVAPLL